jgi:hypothetical protein
MPEKNEHSINPFVVWLFIFSLFAVIGSSFYTYYYTKNFNYLLEASCDEATQVCFVRDCSNPDDCPPNGLSIYTQYAVQGHDFSKCTDDSCLDECLQGIIECEEIPCDPMAEEECSGLTTD